MARWNELARRLVHPDAAAKIRRWLRPAAQPPASYLLTRAVFIRALGIIYFIAFLSYWVQIDGLIGGQGILPAGETLARFRAMNPDLSPIGRFLQMPTVCWISTSDGFLHVLCAGGAVLSCLLVFGLVPVPILAILWLLYLSLTRVGDVFLGYQWDALLLETGFLAIFFAPLKLFLPPTLLPVRLAPSAAPSGIPGRGSAIAVSAPSAVVLFLLRWLLFRVMFLSGLVKLTSGDATWRTFTAMRYHYQTQPLPAWTSWYAHQAPDCFQSLSVGGVLFIELIVPVLVFGNRRLRMFALTMILFLQLLIMATGNFGFFNLLAILLCLTLVDDSTWGRLRPWRGFNVVSASQGNWPRAVPIMLAAVMVLLSIVAGLVQIGASNAVPGPLLDAWAAVTPFESVNGYGLFANMTTQRPELIIEGSDDGSTWRPYEFKYKPDDVSLRPRYCIPHMPRLDWQMWFAAIDLYYNRQVDPWLPKFLARLGEGSPPVLRLMRANPFLAHPPRYLRVVVYEYRFTTFAERARTGAWWERRRLGAIPSELLIQ